MDEFQTWFAPLLWIMGTLTTIGLFVRFCKPVWSFFQMPKQVMHDLTVLKADAETAAKEIAQRLNRFEQTLGELKEHDKSVDQVQRNLLQDRINQGYQYYKQQGHLGEDAYRSFCEMYASYKRLTGDIFIDTVMEQITELYKKDANHEHNRNPCDQRQNSDPIH